MKICFLHCKIKNNRIIKIITLHNLFHLFWNPRPAAWAFICPRDNFDCLNKFYSGVIAPLGLQVLCAFFCSDPFFLSSAMCCLRIVGQIVYQNWSFLVRSVGLVLVMAGIGKLWDLDNTLNSSIIKILVSWRFPIACSFLLKHPKRTFILG